MFRVLLLGFCLQATALQAAPTKLTATNALPFAFSVLQIDEPADQPFSVVTVQISNGDDFINSIDFHCVLENAKGLTWHARGQVTLIDPNEIRKARLVGDRDDDFQKPAAVECYIIGFSAPLM